jgi:catechol 2,3-dioxygenase-like lactoylglutathione lyase family enzyme
MGGNVNRRRFGSAGDGEAGRRRPGQQHAQASPLGRRAWRLAFFADPDGTLLELVER